MNKKIMGLMIGLLTMGSNFCGEANDQSRVPSPKEIKANLEMKEIAEINLFKFDVMMAPIKGSPQRSSLSERGSSPFLSIIEDQEYTDTIYTKKALAALKALEDQKIKAEEARVAFEAREARKSQSTLKVSQESDRSGWRKRSTRSAPALLESLTEKGDE